MTAASTFIAVAAWTLGGLVFGLAYLAALRRTVDIFAGGRGRLLAAALTLGRLTAAIGFFALAARSGALPLLTAFLGFLLARARALRAARGIA